LSFALERIWLFAAIIITVFYLLVLYLLALPNTPENPFASIYSESLNKTACQHLLLLVGFDTLIYRKYYDTPPILVRHHRHSSPPPLPRPAPLDPRLLAGLSTEAARPTTSVSGVATAVMSSDGVES
jgi:hypothetical protein